MEQEDENISLLLNMGFPDVRAIKRALRLGNGDVNEAVVYLTEQPLALTSHNTVDDLRDVDMADGSAMGPPSYDEVGDNGNSMEFPTTNLYELEGRVFTDTWSIPYKREESLGKCLVAATRLAEEGLCDADESCQRFLERCLPECFHKLLSSGAVRRWGPEIQEGVFNMMDFLINFVIVRLKQGPVPENLLKHTFTVAMDSECEWNQKNKHRSAEFIGERNFTETGSQYEPYGWLMDLINMFGNRGGIELIAGRFSNGEDLSGGQMAALLLPMGLCARFLSKDVISPILLPAVTKAIDFVSNIDEKQLKSQKVGSCYDLLEAVRLLCITLWPTEVKRISDLRLEMIIRMLKTPHFSARMNALKELARLIEDGQRRHGNIIDADIIQEWMTNKRVLSLALEGNLDQVQYTDRMKELVEFMGPKMTSEELTRIWNLTEKASPHVTDNIHRIMAAAATRFNPYQFDHLLGLIRKSWDDGNDRLREKLLTFIGKIGQDSRLGRTAEKMLDALWELARVSDLPVRLVHQAMNEHLTILNESANREQLRKNYIIRCVEDIKRSPAVYLPLKQLHYLAKSITKGGPNYFKTEKATLSELNRNHEIVKLITSSMCKCHALAVNANNNQPPSPATLIDGKYSHDDYLKVHLEFLQFLLKEGDIYLVWARCKDIWDTLVANPSASHHDKETCLSWFSFCLNDLENSTQRDLFCEKLLKLDPVTMTQSAFSCFVDYFQAVNLNDHKLSKTEKNISVEKMELHGLEFIWQLVLECSDEKLSDSATQLLLDLAVHSLSPRLRREHKHLHSKFINECYKKLQKSMMRVNDGAVGAAMSNATKTLTAMAVSDMAPIDQCSRSSCLQHIRRVLVLAERYVCSVEEQHSGPRSMPPHAASFIGHPLHLHVTTQDPTKIEIDIDCHSNESMGSVRNKVAVANRVPVDQVQQLTFGDGIVVIGSEQDSKLLHQLNIASDVDVAAKINMVAAAQLKEVGETWDELPGPASYMDNDGAGSSSASGGNGASTSASSGPTVTFKGVGAASGGASAESAAGGAGNSSYNLEQEKQLPGVVMATQADNVFNTLCMLTQLEDAKIVEAVRRVLNLVPTDPAIADKFDSICSWPSAQAMSDAASPKGGTPYGSPAKRDKIRDKEKDREAGKDILKSLLDITASDMTPFRLLYNLEVVWSKIVPLGVEGSSMQGNSLFCEEFLMCGGLSLIVSLLCKDYLPQDVDYEIRQNLYLISLQILRYLLCGPGQRGQEVPITSTGSRPGPPKRSALDASTQPAASHSASNTQPTHASLTPIIANRMVQNFNADEWSEMVGCLMRVAWAGAAGKLYLSSATLTKDPSNLRDPASPQDSKSSRQSSTGSAHSSSSESEGVLQGGVCVQQTTISPVDGVIAQQALHLLIAVLRLRPQLIDRWYGMASVKDFLVEVLVGCSCKAVREMAFNQFSSLILINTPIDPQPKHFLTQVLLKAPLPLWVTTSTTARGATLRFLSQSTEYFSLRSKLLYGLNGSEQKSLGISAQQMLDDEVGWLTNFTATREASRERPESGIAMLRNADNMLLSGHLTLIGALLSCEDAATEETGAIVIPLLIIEYLFPASKLVLESATTEESIRSMGSSSARCTGSESRIAAYQLLVQLATSSQVNLQTLAQQLTDLHHSHNRESIKEFEHAPAVDGRCSSGYVGLKNGGATCYMNSVLQQLYLVQGIPDDILAISSDEANEESLFYQLQSVFGHLKESNLQYYVPDKFWKCFRMDGQPVNVREQQDAFEFYTRLTEQIDDSLRRQKLDSIFAPRFEGVYSIQRICQDCPHRYEREETFLALNLMVTKCNDLQDSLDQFVKGEVLEGENAYYCEKCNQKRTALIRTCIKTLPPVLVIQLKRFGYDWEASRALKFDDYFQFPWVLDMSPYTAEGIAEREEDPEVGETDSPSTQTPTKNSRTSPHSKSSSSPLVTKSSHISPSSTKTTPTLLPSMTTPTKMEPTSSNSSRTPRINTRLRQRGSEYELVGVIVHSGQASAGHYYSYIKDRRGDPIINPNNGRWFKYNDTTVEPVEMTDALLEQECFGGTYKAKVSYDSSNPLPEDRLRYWNAYMLLYDSVEDRLNVPKTPKTPRSQTSRSFRASMSSAKKSLSLGPSSTSERRARSSLSELSQLLQQGERQGMFRQHMPPRILSTITHHNLTFLRNRDLYSQHYYNFIYQLCSSNLQCLSAMTLGMNFLLNTYIRTKDKEESVVQLWVDLLQSFMQQNREASSWAVGYFMLEEGSSHIAPLLLECPDKMVRYQFSILLSNVLLCECHHAEGVTSVKPVVHLLLTLLGSDVPAAIKTSHQYFLLLKTYCDQGRSQCQQVLDLGGFTSLVNFLLGPPDLEKRRWSSIQAQDFGPLHATCAALIKQCDMKPHQTTGGMSPDDGCNETDKLVMPVGMAQVLYGGDRSRWLREAVSAYKEVTGPISTLTEAIIQVATENTQFTNALLTTLMHQYLNAPSNLLKELSQLIQDVLNISDSLQHNRISALLEGFKGTEGQQIVGLLDLIGANKDNDSRRAYQCIKLVVAMSAKVPIARDILTSTQSQLQWAVDWLRGRMDDNSATFATVGNTSNEESNTKNFQRTTSAQLTLEEATALLSEIESTEMEIDCDPVEFFLGDIKESNSERENSPSQENDSAFK